ncbi:hypothetical protein QUF50_04755 [Thiotrichales bacterium HSG1]|nr:hypothetical protein [Thiotrichales bacterium HSG1]
MSQLNFTIDESLYQQVKVFNSMEIELTYKLKSQLFTTQDNLKLEADDEKEILAILEDETFVSNEDFKKKFGL